MKHILPIFVLSIILSAGAAWANEEEHATHQAVQAEAATPSVTETEGLMYRCPMHPEVWQSMPGKCSKCGMKLRPEIKEENSEKGYSDSDHQHGH